MSKLLVDLSKKGLIQPPSFLPENTMYLVQMGSVAYGCEGESSDWDVYGWCIPRKDEVFPHLRGEIPGFGKQHQRFEVWQQHHVDDKESRRQYDFAVYSVVKFFQLCMENNPNMIDALFVPPRCVLHSTETAEVVRHNRNLFLHKGSWHKFKGYAYSQLHKIATKTPSEDSRRKTTVDKYGYDVKFAYHVVRLILECEQILVEHTLDLERNKEQLKAIRRGEWTEDQVRGFFTEKEKYLEKLYHESTLPYSPPEDKIKELLLQVLESHYGSLDKAVVIGDRYEKALQEIAQVVRKTGL